MVNNVIELDNHFQPTAEQALLRALRENLDSCIIVGKAKSGQVYYTVTELTPSEAHWVLAIVQAALLEAAE